jgi:hypothetical protein
MRMVLSGGKLKGRTDGGHLSEWEFAGSQDARLCSDFDFARTNLFFFLGRERLLPFLPL